MDFNDMYTRASAAISEIDEVLDAADGGKAAGKRAIRNRIANENAGDFAGMVTNLVESFGNLTEEKLIAAVTAVTKALAAFDEKINTYLDAQVPTSSETPVELSDEKRAELGAKRKKLFAQVKQLMDLADSFDHDISGWTLPARRNVSGGKRGPQALSVYLYNVQTSDGDDVELPEDAGLNEIAKLYGFKKSADLKAAFRDGATYVDDEGNTQKGIDTSTPPPVFEYTFDNGHVLVAEKPVEA